MKWYTHPLFVFIFSLIALMGSLFLYIGSYLQANAKFEAFVRKHNLDASSLFQTQTWVMILVLSILVGIILIGLLVIYIYYSKVIQLYRQQQNFINGFTHELKTPIASLRLFLDGFLNHELSREDQIRYSLLMKKDVKRLTDNVEQLLHLAKIEDKSYRSQFLTSQLSDFIERLVEKVRAQFPEVNFRLSCPGVEESEVLMDQALVEMAFMNLISNAIRYNDSETKQVEITLENEGRWAVLKVSDNGEGVDKRHMKKIFKKFYQVENSIKGNGLGLYIVSQIAKLHRGQVSAQTNPNQGLCVIIKLPLNKRADYAA